MAHHHMRPRLTAAAPGEARRPDALPNGIASCIRRSPIVSLLVTSVAGLALGLSVLTLGARRR